VKKSQREKPTSISPAKRGGQPAITLSGRLMKGKGVLDSDKEKGKASSTERGKRS